MKTISAGTKMSPKFMAFVLSEVEGIDHKTACGHGDKGGEMIAGVTSKGDTAPCSRRIAAMVEGIS